MLFSVFKIFASNLFSFGGFFENFKKGKKGIGKNILILFCALYCIVVLGGMYIVTLNSTYKSLQQLNQTRLMPLLSFFMSSVIIFVFGFLSASTNYYTGSGEEQFLCMPLKPVHIFGAKFGVTFITDAILGIFIQTVAAVIYGYNERLLLKPSFYLGLIVSAATVSAFVIFVIYFLLILVLKLIPALRKKSILSGVASCFIILFSFGYGMISSKTGLSLDPQYQGQLANPMLKLIFVLAEKSSFIFWLSGALAGKLLPILAMAGIFCIVVFCFIPLMAPVYLSTLNGFSDVKTKKLADSQTEKFLHREVKSSSLFKALYLRDIKTVFREPSFFANGPLLILLLPVILVVSFVIGLKSAGPNAMEEMKNEFSLLLFYITPDQLVKVKYFIVMTGAAFCILLGNSSNVAATSFSREGKGIYNLKAMPVKNQTLVLVKFFHSLTYCGFAFVLVAVFFLVIAKFIDFPAGGFELFAMLMGMFFMETGASVILVTFDMFLDTVNPKLDWDNPSGAFKQNMNAFFGMLTALVLVVVYVLLMIYVLPKNIFGIIIGITFFCAVAAPVFWCYWKYAIKKITVM